MSNRSIATKNSGLNLENSTLEQRVHLMYLEDVVKRGENSEEANTAVQTQLMHGSIENSNLKQQINIALHRR